MNKKHFLLICLVLILGLGFYFGSEKELDPPSLEPLKNADLAGSLVQFQDTNQQLWKVQPSDLIGRYSDERCPEGFELKPGLVDASGAVKFAPVFLPKESSMLELLSLVRNTNGLELAGLYFDGQARSARNTGFYEFLSEFYVKKYRVNKLDNEDLSRVMVRPYSPVYIQAPKSSELSYCQPQELVEPLSVQGKDYWDLMYLPDNSMKNYIASIFNYDLFNVDPASSSLETVEEPNFYRVLIKGSTLPDAGKFEDGTYCFANCGDMYLEDAEVVNDDPDDSSSNNRFNLNRGVNLNRLGARNTVNNDRLIGSSVDSGISQILAAVEVNDRTKALALFKGLKPDATKTEQREFLRLIANASEEEIRAWIREATEEEEGGMQASFEGDSGDNVVIDGSEGFDGSDGANGSDGSDRVDDGSSSNSGSIDRDRMSSSDDFRVKPYTAFDSKDDLVKYVDDSLLPLILDNLRDQFLVLDIYKAFMPDADRSMISDFQKAVDSRNEGVIRSVILENLNIRDESGVLERSRILPGGSNGTSGSDDSSSTSDSGEQSTSDIGIDEPGEGSADVDESIEDEVILANPECVIVNGDQRLDWNLSIGDRDPNSKIAYKLVLDLNETSRYVSGSYVDSVAIGSTVSPYLPAPLLYLEAYEEDFTELIGITESFNTLNMCNIVPPPVPGGGSGGVLRN